MKNQTYKFFSKKALSCILESSGKSLNFFLKFPGPGYHCKIILVLESTGIWLWFAFHYFM